jgi:hypothetical protein
MFVNVPLIRLFNKPSVYGAQMMWPPLGQMQAFATLHKLRLQWPEATDEMKKESKLWLMDHGFTLSYNGVSLYSR